MYYELNMVLGNLTLVLGIIAWAIAQILKGVVHYAQFRKFDVRIIVGGGGMPSSHSAFVCACSTTIGKISGFNSIAFTISASLAIIVMYDASHVRHAAGEQAKILNYMIQHWKEIPLELKAQELKELLGHTNLQVLLGALVGITVGLLGTYLAQLSLMG